METVKFSKQFLEGLTKNFMETSNNFDEILEIFGALLKICAEALQSLIRAWYCLSTPHAIENTVTRARYASTSWSSLYNTIVYLWYRHSLISCWSLIRPRIFILRHQMMSWVKRLNVKLREMKLLAPSENLYTSHPPENRSHLLPTRDPNSPLPLPPTMPYIPPGVEPVSSTSAENTGKEQ